MKGKTTALLLSVGIFLVGMSVPCAAGEGESVEVAYTTDRVNLREGPGVETAKIALVPRDMEVEVVERSDLWCRVRLGGIEGWIHGDFVSYPAPIVEDAAESGAQADSAGADSESDTETS